jgi:hypothetical protein
VGAFALIGWLSHIQYQRYKFNAENGNARLKVILERFENQRDCLEFLQSKRGLQVLNSLTTSTAGMKGPIMVMTACGIVSFSIGIGALILTLVKDGDLIFATAFLSMLGIGLLIAARVSLSLARKWGVFEENQLASETDDSLVDSFGPSE